MQAMYLYWKHRVVVALVLQNSIVIAVKIPAQITPAVSLTLIDFQKSNINAM
jgi:hypothetical protein